MINKKNVLVHIVTVNTNVNYSIQLARKNPTVRNYIKMEEKI
jgi:hypothetical protein